jgi:hypothetical protein
MLKEVVMNVLMEIFSLFTTDENVKISYEINYESNLFWKQII